MKKNKLITPFEENSIKWYSDIVLRSELMSYGPVKGTMFFKPYGFKIWKNIQEKLNIEFEKLDIEEVVFPSIFPYELLMKEKKHIKGFNPEVLKITKIGDKDLNIEYIIRPTSEVLFNTYFKENVVSYNQLPLKLNQWVNIIRWENNTRPFLRNSEFHWQEGHTIHSTKEEAMSFTKKIINIYEKFTKDELLLSVFKGKKTENEKFSGAETTFTIETFLKDGKALQSGTSHYLGENFTKAFDIKIQNKENKFFNPFQTSWGVSTRLIGAIIMTHSDNKGLVLPSKIAPFQVVIITLYRNDLEEKEVLKKAKEIESKLKGFKVYIDKRDKSIGFKAMEWEIKGVPLRIEIGPKDLKENIFNFSIRNKEEKKIKSFDFFNYKNIEKVLINYDQELQKRAWENTDKKIIQINDKSEILKNLDKGNICKFYWEENDELEKKLKEETSGTIRLIEESKVKGKSLISKKDTNKLVIFSRSY